MDEKKKNYWRLQKNFKGKADTIVNNDGKAIKVSSIEDKPPKISYLIQCSMFFRIMFLLKENIHIYFTIEVFVNIDVQDNKKPLHGLNKEFFDMESSFEQKCKHLKLK